MYRKGEGVRISPKIGEGPHLKEEDQRVIFGEFNHIHNEQPLARCSGSL